MTTDWTKRKVEYEYLGTTIVQWYGFQIFLLNDRKFAAENRLGYITVTCWPSVLLGSKEAVAFHED